MKTLILCCLILFPVAEDYKEAFNKGLVAYNQEEYEAAISGFLRSYNLKPHSKTSYYIAISYFKLGKDSLAEKFATQSENELPKLADVPYRQNIQHIYRYCAVAPRFMKVKFKITQSDKSETSDEKKQEEIMKRELEIYYSNTPEGLSQLMEDLMLVQSRKLTHDRKTQIDTVNFKFVSLPITDSL